MLFNFSSFRKTVPPHHTIRLHDYLLHSNLQGKIRPVRDMSSNTKLVRNMAIPSTEPQQAKQEQIKQHNQETQL